VIEPLFVNSGGWYVRYAPNHTQRVGQARDRATPLPHGCRALVWLRFAVWPWSERDRINPWTLTHARLRPAVRAKVKRP